MIVVTYLIVGGVAGWLAGEIMHLPPKGFWKTMGTGILGSVVGGVLMRLIGFEANGILARIIAAVIGACLFLYFAKRTM